MPESARTCLLYVERTTMREVFPAYYNSVRKQWEVLYAGISIEEYIGGPYRILAWRDFPEPPAKGTF